MKKIGRIMTCAALGVVALGGIAAAHGTGEHGGMSHDPQMQKLHAMMPMFSESSAQLETALAKGDQAAADHEAGRILAAIPDLKKSRPHRNVKLKKGFVKLAGQLGEQTTQVRDLARKGEFPAARAAFQKLEATCGECHEKYR
ncbi:hypothetical protein GMLC_43870 [Geomonas limicola]|uniref:Cytochrome c n=1 Tax=Geomonas limicola TaxID=2740186 RepID=A0A6V8NDU2_9BACT|nr:cytochrome c [Geomonas limicola]GFO70808.1 hypothetical protein GMLC_43870 [Geomonas limicola]